MLKRQTILLCVISMVCFTLLLIDITLNAPDTHEYKAQEEVTPQDSHFLVRRDPHTGRDVRVMVSVVSTHMTMAACMNVASGYLSGIPVHIVGYDSGDKYNHVHKVRWVLDAARKVGLTSEDVVFFMDSDTVFTGPEQFLAVVDGFIAQSASSADELDARAVREGRVRAPMIVSREHFCFSPQAIGTMGMCAQAFNRTNEAYNAYARSRGINQYVKQFSYINSGTYIARLWALEEFAAAFYGYMRQNPIPKLRRQWYCDQSIFNALYLDLRSWEVSQDALTVNHKAAFATPRSQYGLRAGLLEVDERWELANVWVWKDCIISNEFWLEDPNTEVALTESPFARNFEAYTAQIYNQYKQPLHRYTLPPTTGRSSRSASAHTHQFFGHAVPPTEVADHGGNVLLATVPRRVAPAILHDAGVGPYELRRALGSVPVKDPTDKETLSSMKPKIVRMAHKVPHLSWYIPLKYNATRMTDAKAYLSQLRIPLISKRVNTVASYKKICIDVFVTVTEDPVLPSLYEVMADAYNLFFDYYQ